MCVCVCVGGGELVRLKHRGSLNSEPQSDHGYDTIAVCVCVCVCVRVCEREAAQLQGLWLQDGRGGTVRGLSNSR